MSAVLRLSICQSYTRKFGRPGTSVMSSMAILFRGPSSVVSTILLILNVCHVSALLPKSRSASGMYAVAELTDPENTRLCLSVVVRHMEPIQTHSAVWVCHRHWSLEQESTRWKFVFVVNVRAPSKSSSSRLTMLGCIYHRLEQSKQRRPQASVDIDLLGCSVYRDLQRVGTKPAR